MTVFGVIPVCPCGTGAAYDGCCGRFHRGEQQAATAEELMRSRFSAYVAGDGDYLIRTWHPRTRPPVLDVDLNAASYHLEIVATSDGGPRDDAGVVEFVAQLGPDVIRERSNFARRGGRWMYVDGVLDP